MKRKSFSQHGVVSHVIINLYNLIIIQIHNLYIQTDLYLFFPSRIHTTLSRSLIFFIKATSLNSWKFMFVAVKHLNVHIKVKPCGDSTVEPCSSRHNG